MRNIARDFTILLTNTNCNKIFPEYNLYFPKIFSVEISIVMNIMETNMVFLDEIARDSQVYSGAS